MSVGIDLGTSTTLAACIAGSKPMVVPDARGPQHFWTPSAVVPNGSRAWVGRPALLQAERDPQAPLQKFFKRRLGSRSPVCFDADGNAWTAESLSALLLRKVATDIEAFAPAAGEATVISTPAHFSVRQREAVYAAAAMANIDEVHLVEEPVAAALAAVAAAGERDQVQPEVRLIFDFGGGTFDASIVAVNERSLYVLAKEGVSQLGGKDLDDAVSSIVLEQYEQSGGLLDDLSGRDYIELGVLAERLKIDLSRDGCEHASAAALLADRFFEADISRQRFETLAAPFFERAEAAVERCISGAGLLAAEVQEVLMVGGSSLAPAVRGRLELLFPDRVRMYNPSEAVAQGSALRAAQLDGKARRCSVPPEFRGVSGYSIGVRTIGSGGSVQVETFAARNLPLPHVARRTFYASRIDQRRLALELVHDGGEEDRDELLGSLVVDLPVGFPPNRPIDVTLQYGDDGRIHVQTTDAASGRRMEQCFLLEGASTPKDWARQQQLVRQAIINCGGIPL